MNFGPYFEKLVYGKQVERNQKTYLCWKCGKNYIEPADYLWHIQYC